MTVDKGAAGLKSKYKLFYVLSVAALAGVLLANFGLVYTVLVTPPDDLEALMKLVYLIMVAGFLVLAAQALLVFTRFVSLIDKESEAIENLDRQVKEMTVHDVLTKVYNRSKFEQVAERELENVRRYETQVSAIMFDIDNFKSINEAQGYKIGDRLLTSLAQFIKSKMRSSDYVFRWRGGKFIILAPHTDIDKAAMVAEKLRQIVGHKLFGGTVRMTLSLGVAQVGENDSIETFIHRIQSALAGAKNQGKNRVVVNRG